jgi:hypothetical protein
MDERRDYHAFVLPVDVPIPANPYAQTTRRLYGPPTMVPGMRLQVRMIEDQQSSVFPVLLEWLQVRLVCSRLGIACACSVRFLGFARMTCLCEWLG